MRTFGGDGTKRGYIIIWSTCDSGGCGMWWIEVNIYLRSNISFMSGIGSVVRLAFYVVLFFFLFGSCGNMRNIWRGKDGLAGI